MILRGKERALVSHDWLIETLSELQVYARAHDLSALAQHLEQAVQLAHLDIARIEAAHPSGSSSDRKG